MYFSCLYQIHSIQGGSSFLVASCLYHISTLELHLLESKVWKETEKLEKTRFLIMNAHVRWQDHCAYNEGLKPLDLFLMIDILDDILLLYYHCNEC